MNNNSDNIIFYDPESSGSPLPELFCLEYLRNGLLLKFSTDGNHIYGVTIDEHGNEEVRARQLAFHEKSCHETMPRNTGSMRNDSAGNPAKAGFMSEKICKYLDEYFCGIPPATGLPVALRGTVFQRTVWLAMLEIPFGSTVSYKELAEAAGFPAAFRAAAGACRANRIPLLVPCHRVIASDGRIGGFSGREKKTGLKRMLLGIEGVFIPL